MATHPFLSETWLVEARAIRSEYDGRGSPIGHAVRMNLVITSVPFESEILAAHLDTTSGELRLDLGHIDPVDHTVTLDYDIAKAILIEGNPQAGMQAFMAGKVKVEGDMAKLLALQGGVSDPSTAEVAARIKAITE